MLSCSRKTPTGLGPIVLTYLEKLRDGNVFMFMYLILYHLQLVQELRKAAE
jgi:hypothetical protein